MPSAMTGKIISEKNYTKKKLKMMSTEQEWAKNVGVLLQRTAWRWEENLSRNENDKKKTKKTSVLRSTWVWVDIASQPIIIWLKAIYFQFNTRVFHRMITCIVDARYVSTLEGRSRASCFERSLRKSS